MIEGVDGTDARKGGKLAVLTKVHHAAVDGVTGANLMSQLCTTEPDAPPPDPVEGHGDTNPLRIALGGLGRFATRPLQLATNVLPATVTTVVDTIRRAASGRAMAAPFAAPQTPFNASVTAHRNVAFAQLDLEDIKTVKNHFGVKVNDVVMALVSGVLRQFLLDRGELPESSLVAMVPVSVHDRSDRPGRNQVSGMFSKLETQIEDPAERLTAIAEANTTAKEHSSAIGATLLQDWSQFAGPAVFGVAMRVYARSRLTESRPVHNLVVSNVPGPQIPLYFLGAEVTAMYPLGPIFHGSGLNITVMSLNGKLDVGLISCPELLPDLWDMADDFAVGMKELLDAAKPAPNTAASRRGAARKPSSAGRCARHPRRTWQHVCHEAVPPPARRPHRPGALRRGRARARAPAAAPWCRGTRRASPSPRIGQPVQWGPCRVAGGGGGNALPIPAGAAVRQDRRPGRLRQARRRRSPAWR